MRVAIAGFHTETNTFSPVPADFDGILRRGEIPAALSGSHHTVAGFLERCGVEPNLEVVPLVYANAWACGTMGADVLEQMCGEVLDGLASSGPFDVVLLAQHGAAVAEGAPDADGELLTRVRATVGADVTIGVSLDLHGNVTQQLIDAADVTVGYRENPHRDPRVRGAECARLALAAARGERRPVQRLVRLPMVVPILGGWTEGGGMREAMDAAAAVADRHDLLSYTVFHGFGYADVPHLGSSVLAITDGDGQIADVAAHELAACLWERREQLRGKALAPAEAVAEAHRRADDGGPIVLLDVGDNIGGGSPADSTVLLAEAIEQGVGGFVATVCDAQAVQRARDAGEGVDVVLEVGATTPVSVGPRLTIRGHVARVTDGRFEDRGVSHAGFRSFHGGPTVRVSTDAGQELILTSRPVPTFTPEQLTAVGVDAGTQRVIVAKGVVAPRAGYAPIAARFLLVDTPGCTAADLSHLRYHQRPQPLWPLEAGVRFSPSDEEGRGKGRGRRKPGRRW